jgi:hypothetical protein
MLSIVLTVLASGVYAAGYGTSSITLSSSSVNLNAGSNVRVNYTVNLASGNTWGTTLAVTNNNQLATQGITTSMSNPSGDPPFSGILTITASASAAPGPYTVTLAATGDDPSTSDANLALNVAGMGANSTTAPTTTVSGATTSIAQSTTIAVTSTVAYPPTGYSYSGMNMLFFALIAVVIIGMIYMVATKKAPDTRLIIVGVALILLGIVVWLYGDYNGGIMSYIWGGVIAILVGTVIWLYGDHKGQLI